MTIDARGIDMSQFASKEKKTPMTIGHWASVIAREGVIRAREQYYRLPLQDSDPEKVWRNAVIGLAIGDIYHIAEPQINHITPPNRYDAQYDQFVNPAHIRLKSQAILGKMDAILQDTVEDWIKRKDQNGLSADVQKEAGRLKPLRSENSDEDPLFQALSGGIGVQIDNERASLITIVDGISKNNTLCIDPKQVTIELEKTYASLLSPHATRLSLPVSQGIEDTIYQTRVNDEEETSIIGYDDAKVLYTPSGLHYNKKNWEQWKSQSGASKNDISDVTGCPAHLSSRITRLVFDPSAQPAYDNVIHGLHKQFVQLLRK